MLHGTGSGAFALRSTRVFIERHLTVCPTQKAPPVTTCIRMYNKTSTSTRILGASARIPGVKSRIAHGVVPVTEGSFNGQKLAWGKEPYRLSRCTGNAVHRTSRFDCVNNQMCMQTCLMGSMHGLPISWAHTIT